MQKLFLIPTTLGDTAIDHILPGIIHSIINSIDFYIVENERTARRFLLKAGLQKPVDDITFFILNKYTAPGDTEAFFQAISMINFDCDIWFVRNFETLSDYRF